MSQSRDLMCALRLRRAGMPFAPRLWPWGPFIAKGPDQFCALRRPSVPLAANLSRGQIA